MTVELATHRPAPSPSAQSAATVRTNGPAEANLAAAQSTLNAAPSVQRLLAMRASLATPVVQRVMRIQGDIAEDFDKVGGFFADVEGMKDDILRAAGPMNPAAAATLLDSAVRTSTFDLDDWKKKHAAQDISPVRQQEVVTRELRIQVGRIERGKRSGIQQAVETFDMPEDVAQTLVNHLGAPEVKRLSRVIGNLWQSGHVSLDRIIVLLSDAALSGPNLPAFETLFGAFKNNPAALRLLGGMSPESVLETAIDPKELERFKGRLTDIEDATKKANALPDLRHKFRLDPAKVIELSGAERFTGLGALTGGLRDDLALIMQDNEFNLRQDLSYLASLEARFNRTASAPAGSGHAESGDAAMLRAEIQRARKAYAHKINYISVMQNWQTHLNTQIDTIRQLADQEVKELTRQRDAVVTPPSYKPGPRTTKGYAQKMTRQAERGQDAANKQRAGLGEQIAGRKKRIAVDIAKAEKKLFADVAKFFDMDASFTALMRQGMLLATSDTRLAGIFPKSDQVRIEPGDMDRESEILLAQSSKLIKNYGLFVGSADGGRKKGLIPEARRGCVCIMYLKEGGGKKAATYRPVFGASGMKPYGRKPSGQDDDQIERKSYADMGVPAPEPGTYPEAVKRLEAHRGQQKRLGIKLPAKQAELYYLQYPDYHANKTGAGGVRMIGMLESWGPSNCAEPAIMTGIYQLYHQPRDIHLSTPFEGDLGPQDKPLLKYTCARCAMAEPAFMSPTKTEGSPSGKVDGQRHVEMRVGKTVPHPPHKALFDKTLVANATKPNHPYDYGEKPAAIEDLASKNATGGQMHIRPARNPAAAKRKAQRRITKVMQEAQRLATAPEQSEGE